MASEGKVLIREITTAVQQSRSLGACSVLIRVHDMAASPQEQVLTNGSLVLGAGRGADIVIGDDSVSRKHLQVVLSNQGVDIVDLNSSNGTYYQGQRIGRMTLDREATFVLGRVRVTITPQVSATHALEMEVTHYGDILGVSPVMRHLFSNLTQLESSTVPLLIEGEAGTGLRLLAREIHQHSAVRSGPFIDVNCAALELSTAREELLGSRDIVSARTGESKLGSIELARGGTLYLREISGVAFEIQPLLLAALESVKVVRPDSGQEPTAQLRVIASSSRSLGNETTAGRFQQDLYYLLNVVTLRAPALRERHGDIGLLARHFAGTFGVVRLPPQVVEQLEHYDWPGNVRELRNVIRGYAAVGELPQAPIAEDSQLAEMLRQVLDVQRPYQQQKDHVLNKFLDVYLSMLLEHTGGNQSKASRMSGIERAHLNRMIAKLRGDSKRAHSGPGEGTGDSVPPPPKRRNSSMPPRAQ